MTKNEEENIELILKNLASAILFNQPRVVKSHIHDLRISIGLEEYPKYLTSLDIHNEVCEKFNVTPDELLIRSRKHKYTIPRFTLMYIWREYFKMGVNQIIRKFRIRDHSMVSYAKGKVAEWLEYDREYAEKVKTILDKCKNCKCRVI